MHFCILPACELQVIKQCAVIVPVYVKTSCFLLAIPALKQGVQKTCNAQ